MTMAPHFIKALEGSVAPCQSPSSPEPTMFHIHMSNVFSFLENDNYDDGFFHFGSCIFLQDFDKFHQGDHVQDIGIGFEDNNIIIWDDEESYDPECLYDIPMPLDSFGTFEDHLSRYN